MAVRCSGLSDCDLTCCPGEWSLMNKKPGQWFAFKVTDGHRLVKQSRFKILYVKSFCLLTITYITRFDSSHSNEMTGIKACSKWSCMLESSLNCLPETACRVRVGCYRNGGYWTSFLSCMVHMYRALGVLTHNWPVVDLSLLLMVNISADAGLTELVLLGKS